MSASTRGGRRERISPALWFLAGAVGLLLAGGVVTLLRLRAKAPYSPPSAGDPTGPVAVWRGDATNADGVRVVVELSELHADAGRQAFETATLRRRLGLGEGQPWRLRVVRAGAANAREALAIVAPVIEDAAGVAANSFELPPLDGAVQDPLWSLLRIPREPLAYGEACDLVLWGRAPEGDASLRGLRLGAQDFELALSPAQASRAELERPFTHSTRGDELAQSGKSPAAAASQRRPRTRNGSDD